MKVKEVNLKNHLIILEVLMILVVTVPLLFSHVLNSAFSLDQTIPETEIQYYMQTAGPEAFETVRNAPDSDFSISEKSIGHTGASVWVRFHLDSHFLNGKNVIYTVPEYRHINSIYTEAGGIKHNLSVCDEYIYPSAVLPHVKGDGPYIYVNLSTPYIGSETAFRIADKADFVKYQNRLFAFRTASIAILAVLFFLNIILAVFDRQREYSLHALLLFTLGISIFQISNVQKLIWGQSDMYMGYCWGAVACFLMILFQYEYFGIRSQSASVIKLCRGFIACSILAAAAVILVQTPEIVKTVSFFFNVLCLASLGISVYAYCHTKTVPLFFVIGAGMLFLGMTAYIGASFGILQWNELTANLVYLAASAEAVMFTAGILRQVKKKQQLIDLLMKEADTDRLTGLYNRNYFDRVAVPKINEWVKNSRPVSLLMLDVDFFKQVNDTYGHSTGDRLLSKMAEIMASCIRKKDDIIRWGGEEFLFILYGSGTDAAKVVAERIRKNVEADQFLAEKGVTVSIGVTEKKPDEEIEHLINLIDQSMYKAKKEGRNRISVSYGNSVPLRVEWSPIFQCGNGKIDEEHRELMMQVNQMIEMALSNYQETDFLTSYDQLVEYIKKHFVDEEKVFSQTQYPDIEKHKQLHRDIIEKAAAVRADFVDHRKSPVDVIKFLIAEVVIGPLILEDSQFFKYL